MKNHRWRGADVQRCSRCRAERKRLTATSWQYRFPGTGRWTRPARVQMCQPSAHRVMLDDSELELLLEALDSHARTGKLSADEYRSNGFVLEPGTEDEDDAAELADVNALDAKLRAILKPTEVRDARHA